ncbi:hypothetical protein DUI87_07613 [Hirundo rustica rustica]|uniref:Uncharacterized protein n=1 Tax=Hirundo rustica rustica TaxID=333673 RepID=A0A3M0KQ56_HIRRU|nr:hypothetical protein DUI87_07613 [Hirundo rustica rustica]
MESSQASGQLTPKGGSSRPSSMLLTLSGQKEEEKGPTYRKFTEFYMSLLPKFSRGLEGNIKQKFLRYKLARNWGGVVSRGVDAQAEQHDCSLPDDERDNEITCPELPDTYLIDFCNAKQKLQKCIQFGFKYTEKMKSDHLGSPVHQVKDINYLNSYDGN